jgi:hypothetical protein
VRNYGKSVPEGDGLGPFGDQPHFERFQSVPAAGHREHLVGTGDVQNLRLGKHHDGDPADFRH